MAKTLQDMWTIGHDAAYNPSRWTRIKHSAFVHRNKKPRKVLKNLAVGLVELIEPPVIGTLVTEAVNTALDKYRDRRIKNKLNGYKNRGDLEKEVKHGIKALDMEELDRARAKVRDALADLNKQLQSLEYIDHPCQGIFNITKSYSYLDKRVDLLIARATVVEEVARKTGEWAVKMKDEINNKKPRTDKALNDIMKWAKNDWTHEKCDRKMCIKT